MSNALSFARVLIFTCVTLLLVISCSDKSPTSVVEPPDDASVPTAPTVSTSSVESINENSAQSGGNVTDDGGASVTERGVCWSLSQNPTTNDSCTSDGSGTGSFTSSLTNLSSDTQYFVRAYATNGAGTGYGEEISFTTRSEADSGDWPRDTETEVVDVTNPVTGRTWMDRNLGASRAATSMDDEEAYGDLYQWGRPADGHQKRNSSTTTTLSNSDQPSHGDFIHSSSGSNYDWRSPQNGDLWQGVNGVNNPCPDGYRLPTEAEWEAERQSWSTNNRDGAFESPLKLPVTGTRGHAGGGIRYIYSYGYYWSSSISGTQSLYLYFNINGALFFSDTRATGNSVRCIKD
ncbi:FISUMP domain-containing protein [Rhodohalobacter sp. 8-1]|uniref:FISUMP domain-containing protein n=1 Tax=Rhodohalobacter sp. 8-1 TaxID=3131972 RepID=UPI0030EED5D1